MPASPSSGSSRRRSATRRIGSELVTMSCWPPICSSSRLPTPCREISSAEADRALDLVSESGIDLRPTTPLLTRAMDIARRLNHPVYDCVYLALAAREHASFVTADRRLLRRIPTRALQVAVVDLRTF